MVDFERFFAAGPQSPQPRHRAPERSPRWKASICDGTTAATPCCECSSSPLRWRDWWYGNTEFVNAVHFC